MKNINKYIIALSAAAVLTSCTHEFPEPVEATSGNADFTKLVSVGNSLTAGYLNGALYTAGQDNSFPSIIAQQMQSVGGGTFNQPDIGSEHGFFGVSGTTILGRLRLVGISPTPHIPGDIPTAYGGDKSALNNFGVPGVTLLTALIPATGGPDAGAANPAYNPLYARFASSPSADGVTGSTVIGDAAAALADNGSFFTFWLGNNDVLGYATGGASNPAILTSPGDFDSRLQSALGTMLAANENANGAVANIPNVSDVPYFTVVPWNALPLDAGTAALVNGAFNDPATGYNPGLGAALALGIIDQEEYALRTVEYIEGQNGILIEDDELTTADISAAFGFPAGSVILPNYRLTNATDLIVLPTAAEIGQLADPNNPLSIKGVAVALGDNAVVTAAELVEVNESVTAFNSSIAAMVDANSDRLVLVDVNTIFSNLVANGAAINGSGIDASFIPPFGAFSVDGVHPNSRGYAYIANRFIEAINGKFNSDIPLVNPNDYAGNELPE
jgi:hypothetical protein